MASGANDSSRLEPQGPADVVEDIDAGWDELLEFARVPDPYPRPLSSAATDKEPAASSIAPAPLLSSLPPVRKDVERRSTALALAFVAIGALVLVAGIALNRREHRIAQAALSTEQPAAEQRALVRAPNAPAVQPPAAVTPPATASTALAATDDAAETSAVKAAGATSVSVRTIPRGAVIFRAGRRIGTGFVDVSVEHNAKLRLTALLDGYSPSSFTLDGSRSSVTVVLKRPPAVHEPARSGDVPPVASSNASDPAAAATPAVAAAPADAKPSADAPPPDEH